MTPDEKPAYYTRAQKCPQCNAEVPMSAPRCWLCGHQFMSKAELEADSKRRYVQQDIPGVVKKRSLGQTAALVLLTFVVLLITFGVGAETGMNGVVLLIAFFLPMSLIWGGNDPTSSIFARLARGLFITILVLVGLFAAAFVALLMICSNMNFH